MINRLLIIKQPWIDLILSGQKIWEMRSSPTNIRERIGLVEQGTGLIIGEADIIGCIDNLTVPTLISSYDKHKITDEDVLKRWRYAWVLENVIRYEKPIPYEHPRGAVIWVRLN